MKKLAKLVGIIALVAVIGFAFITCDDGGGGRGGDDDWVPSNGPWPSEWLTSDSSSFWYISNISSSRYLQVMDYEGWIWLDGASNGTHYQITSMTLDNQGIKVKELKADFKVTGGEITLCTSWTFQNNSLTLRGTTGVFKVFEGKALFP
jgi:hypothetical protein